MIGLSIAAREKDEKISYGVLDPSAFAEDGGPSLAERISKGACRDRTLTIEKPKPDEVRTV
jgi:hypothetical protein